MPDEIRPRKFSSWQERFLATICRPSIQWKSFCKKVQTDRCIVRYRNHTVNECNYCSSVSHRRRWSRGRADGSHAPKTAREESEEGKQKTENYDSDTRRCWASLANEIIQAQYPGRGNWCALFRYVAILSGRNMSIISIVDKNRSLSIVVDTNQSTNIGNR